MKTSEQFLKEKGFRDREDIWLQDGQTWKNWKLSDILTTFERWLGEKKAQHCKGGCHCTQGTGNAMAGNSGSLRDIDMLCAEHSAGAEDDQQTQNSHKENESEM